MYNFGGSGVNLNYYLGNIGSGLIIYRGGSSSYYFFGSGFVVYFINRGRVMVLNIGGMFNDLVIIFLRFCIMKWSDMD